jgi:hypothetical protein
MDGRLPRLTTLLVALLALAAPALAPVATARADDSPAARWPAGGSTLRTALAMAAEHWGMEPCGGRVAMRWIGLDSGTNAQSSWANEIDPYLQPSRNTECAIVLSTSTEWDWVKLCSIVVHEAGHLTGHDHVDDPGDIMYYAYVRPAPECAGTPEPVETGPPPAAPPAAAPAAAAAPRTAAKEASAAKGKATAARPRKAAKRRRPATQHRSTPRSRRASPKR